MLYASRVTQQLEASAERFRVFAETESAAFHRFDRAISLLDQLDHDAILQAVADAEHPGALPGEEWIGQSGLVIPFKACFADHRAARGWALDRIRGIPTVAVDGSEIKPTKDYSLPIAAVQVAWFENPHREDLHYVKDAAFEIIHPDEIAGEPGDGFGSADQKLALRRFQAEVRTLIRCMTSLREQYREGLPPVAFFDGSLIVSFTRGMLEDYGTRYIEEICHLLQASEQLAVPLVGFVDTSLAKDLTTLLAVLGHLPRPQRVPDSRLLERRLAWGDRTRALVCARDDVLDRYQVAADETPGSTPFQGSRDFSREICFVYLKTNGLAPPARLDIPRWVVRAGLLEHVIDVVRAEVIIGNGYPYCIETADACAVLSVHDRERFYRLVQDFAGRHGIALRIVPKAASKRRRRV